MALHQQSAMERHTGIAVIHEKRRRVLDVDQPHPAWRLLTSGQHASYHALFRYNQSRRAVT